MCDVCSKQGPTPPCPALTPETKQSPHHARTRDVSKVLPHDALDRLERERHDVWVRVPRGGREHHEHALPARLDVVDARQHHLAHTADDELADLNSLWVCVVVGGERG